MKLYKIATEHFSFCHLIPVYSEFMTGVNVGSTHGTGDLFRWGIYGALIWFWPFSTICLCAVLAGAYRPSLCQIDFILDSWIPIAGLSLSVSVPRYFYCLSDGGSVWWGEEVTSSPHCLFSVLTKPPQVFIQPLHWAKCRVITPQSPPSDQESTSLSSFSPL